MGGDLGESIPKGIDVGLCEALVKSKQPNTSPLRLTAAAGFLEVSSVAGSHRGLAPPKPATSQTACLKQE